MSATPEVVELRRYRLGPVVGVSPPATLARAAAGPLKRLTSVPPPLMPGTLAASVYCQKVQLLPQPAMGVGVDAEVHWACHRR